MLVCLQDSEKKQAGEDSRDIATANNSKMPEVKASSTEVVVFCGLVVAWMIVWYVSGVVNYALFVSKRMHTAEQKHKDIGVNKLIALQHAVYATVHSSAYFFYFVYDAPDQRYNCSESTWRAWRRLYPAGFVGYLVLDFIMELRKKKPGTLMLVHHAVFTAVAFISMAYEKGCLQYTVTMMSEVSTVVFVSRWFLIATKQRQSLIKTAEYVFAFLFFFMRIIVFGYGTWVSISEDPDVFADASLWQLTPVMYILGYVMQIVWMYEIVMMAVRPPRKTA